jgi:hypothetical protein
LARRIEQETRILDHRQIGAKATDPRDHLAMIKHRHGRRPRIGGEGDLRFLTGQLAFHAARARKALLAIALDKLMPTADHHGRIVGLGGREICDQGPRQQQIV